MNSLLIIPAYLFSILIGYYSHIKYIKRLGYTARINSKNMYNLGLQDGKFWEQSYLKKYYEASTPPISEEEIQNV